MFLVTGGAGFIGSHVVEALLARGEEVVCLDDFNDFYDPAAKRKNIESHLIRRNYRLVEADICDATSIKEVFSKFRPKRIIHLAARAGIRPSISEPHLYQNVNCNGTLILLEECRKHAVEQFIFASSSSVYGNSAKAPFREDAAINRPISPYALTKYSGELMCYTYHYLYQIPITCLRLFSVYGQRQRPDMAIHKFVRMIYEGQPIPHLGDGSTARDYTHVQDIVHGILSSVDKPFPFEVFNLGESYSVTLSDLVGKLAGITGREVRLLKLPPQPGDVELTFADINKARQLLGYAPCVALDAGLELFVDWYRQLHEIKTAS